MEYTLVMPEHEALDRHREYICSPFISSFYNRDILNTMHILIDGQYSVVTVYYLNDDAPIEFLTNTAWYFDHVIVVGEKSRVDFMEAEYKRRCFYPKTNVTFQGLEHLLECLGFINSLSQYTPTGKRLILNCGIPSFDKSGYRECDYSNQRAFSEMIINKATELGMMTISFEMCPQTMCGPVELPPQIYNTRKEKQNERKQKSNSDDTVKYVS
ncbi:MAG: hypothetical protein K2O54_01460 [Prevotella sp.]|nr:hypothetical protein [Prevotella sp.]